MFKIDKFDNDTNGGLVQVLVGAVASASAYLLSIRIASSKPLRVKGNMRLLMSC